ncbi:MAG: hypothetical protein Kow0090_20100 [Myxococcota bacterium]
MAKKADIKFTAAAYLLPPIALTVGFSVGIIPRFAFAILISLLLFAEMISFFLPRMKGVERAKPFALLTVILSALFAAGGAYQGVIRGRLVFEQILNSESTAPFSFKASGPLEVDIEGAFVSEGRGEEVGKYHLVISDGRNKDDVTGEFTREWYRIKRGRKRSANFAENVAGIFLVGKGGERRDWTLKVEKIDENIGRNFHISVYEPLLPGYIPVVIGLILALIIVVMEFRHTKRLAASTRFADKLRQEFPPASWLVISAFLFLLFYPLSSGGIFIERGFIVSVPGAAVGGIILSWLLQQILYKNLPARN